MKTAAGVAKLRGFPASSPPSVVMVMLTVVPAVPGGARTVIGPLGARDGWLRIFACADPKNTVLTSESSAPWMVTTTPPDAGPDAGLLELTTGLPA